MADVQRGMGRRHVDEPSFHAHLLCVVPTVRCQPLLRIEVVAGEALLSSILVPHTGLPVVTAVGCAKRPPPTAHAGASAVGASATAHRRHGRTWGHGVGA